MIRADVKDVARALEMMISFQVAVVIPLLKLEMTSSTNHTIPLNAWNSAA